MLQFLLLIYRIEIKKSALKILNYLVVNRDDAKNEVLEHGVIEQCIKHVD